MAKKKQAQPNRNSSASAERSATLKDLLPTEMLEKLKAQQAELEAEENRIKAEKQKQEETSRKAEQKRRDNDFSYLLENSKLDWRNYKE